jgi:mercuric ion binding protein
MQKLKSILFLVILTSFIFSCKNNETTVEKKTVVAQKNEKTPATKPEVATFHIEGMTCEIGCAKTIEEALNELDGVQEAKVDFEKKQATINFDLDKLSTADLVKTAEACADGKTYKVSDVKTGKI